MKLVHKFIEQIDEELEGAKEYAERYIENRAKGNSNRASKYKEMAGDELRHAGYVYDFAVMDVADIKKVYPMPIEAEEAWTHAMKHYAECVAMVKHMLT